MDRVRTPSPALVVATIALVLALTGAAAALPGRNTVDAGDIEKGAVGTKELQRNAVRGPDVRKDALKGRQVFESKLGPVPEAESVQTVDLFGDGYERVTATEGPSLAGAQAAAPRIELAAAGQLRIYAKCFRDAGAQTVYGRVYIETGADGAVVESGFADLGGGAPGGYLNPATPEGARVLMEASAGSDDAAIDRGDWFAMAPDGTGIGGRVAVAVKSGTLAAGEGVYGAGEICLFDGDSIG